MLGNAIAGFTSVRGRSHTFDRRADGYARGEAIGLDPGRILDRVVDEGEQTMARAAWICMRATFVRRVLAYSSEAFPRQDPTKFTSSLG